MIPSAIADAKVFSVLPNNGDGDFTFNRDSSATRVGQNGLIQTVAIDLPRLNYDISNGVVQSCPSLLLEGASTNLVPYSQTFTGWTLTNTVETPNALISPDGNLNASKFVTNNLGVDIKYTNIPVVQNTTYTYSFYCNYVGGLGLQGRFYDNTNGANIEFYDYMNQIEEGKWKRVTRTFTTPSGCSNIQIWYLAASSTFPVTAYYWGAQLEALSYATSYIPTLSGAIQTRTAESCSKTGLTNYIGQTEGTIYAEAKIDGLKNSNTIVTLHNGSFSEYLVIAGNLTGNINAYIFAGGVQQAGIFSGTYAVDSVVKCAMAYKQNDVAFYINGVLIGTDSSATMASTSIFDVGSISFGNYPLQGSVKQAQLYKTRLTDAQLQTLTTL